jgi:hypothetical protein
MATGRIQNFGFAAAGASPTFVYKGIITGGNHALHSEPIPLVGIGSAIPLSTRPGLASGSGTVDFDVNDDMKGLLVSYGIRTAGALPEVGISAGDTNWAADHNYAMCTGWSLKGEAGGKLSGSFSWLTRSGAETSGAQTMSITASTPVYLWYEFAITGITGLAIRSFDISVTHKVELDPVMATPSAAAVRLADAFADAGQDYVNFRMTLRAQAGTPHLPMGDTLAAIASTVITFTSAEKPASLPCPIATCRRKTKTLVQRLLPARVCFLPQRT